MATPQNADCVLGSSTVGATLQLNCTIALTSVGDEQSQTSAYRNFYSDAKPDVISYVTFVVQTSFAIFQTCVSVTKVLFHVVNLEVPWCNG